MASSSTAFASSMLLACRQGLQEAPASPQLSGEYFAKSPRRHLHLAFQGHTKLAPPRAMLQPCHAAPPKSPRCRVSPPVVDKVPIAYQHHPSRPAVLCPNAQQNSIKRCLLRIYDIQSANEKAPITHGYSKQATQSFLPASRLNFCVVAMSNCRRRASGPLASARR